MQTERFTKLRVGPGVLLTMAAFVVLVAGMKAAQAILVPFLVAAFLALICGPPMFWLQRRGVPSVLALLIVVAVICGIGVGVGALLGNSFKDFTAALPAYQARLQERTEALIAWTDEFGIALPANILSDVVNPGQIMQLVGRVVSGIGGLVTNSFLIALTVIFILLEASSFPAKLRAAFWDSHGAFGKFDQVAANVNRYLAIKTAVSLATGVMIAVWLAAVGVDFPLLWGLLTFLLNYVPNIGSIIAAVPAVLLAVIQLGPGPAGLAALGYFVTNFVMGNLIEPRFMGRGLGLSPLVVFLSLVFWGWVFGAVGMLLSVPLTMTVKIALESSDETRWIAVLLGSEAAAEAAPAPKSAVAPATAEK